MDLRQYSPADLASCLELVPALEPPEHFFVLEHEGAILACGGFTLQPPSAATFLACAVHPSWRHQGLGRYGLMYLLKRISSTAPVEFVHVTATPSEANFYLANGFRGNQSGAEPVQLLKRLTVCT